MKQTLIGTCAFLFKPLAGLPETQGRVLDLRETGYFRVCTLLQTLNDDVVSSAIVGVVRRHV